MPLVIDLHGAGSNGYQQQYISGWDKLADSEKFYVVYPDGTGTENIQTSTYPLIGTIEVDLSTYYWNAGPGFNSDVDDLGFLLAMVQAIQGEANIDPSQIFVTGLSNGAAMTQKLACESADSFAGFAPLAFGLPMTVAQCNPSREVPVLLSMGLEDAVVPYIPNASDGFEAWREINSCGVGTSTAGFADGLNPDQNHCVVDESCNSGAKVGLCSIHGADQYLFQVKVNIPIIGEVTVHEQNINAQGHILYFNDHDVNVAGVIWDFLQSQTNNAPDLVVNNPGVNDAALETGESFTLSATTYNQGSAPAGTTILHYYISDSPTIDTSKTELDTDTVGSLAAGTDEMDNTITAAPGSPGTYWVGACVDAVTGESNVGNQCSSGVQITVSTPTAPDLVVISPGVDDSSLAFGQSYSLSATSHNQGSAPAAATTLRYYRSEDATITGADIPLGADDVDGLGASESEPDSIHGTAPAAPGSWWLGACIDAVSGESNIDNQCSSGVPITVSEEPPSPGADSLLCFPVPAAGKYSIICL